MICTESIKNTIYEFGRNTDDTAYVKKVTDFKPYFYYKHPDGKHKSIFGEPLKKIICKEPSEIPKLREGKEHFEADVPFINKYLIDRYDGTLKQERIRKCFIDIEVDSTRGFPDTNNPISEIQAIGC